MPIALAARLRDATRLLHTEVERAGLMRSLLRGDVDRDTYCRLLRSLHAVYAALEDGLALHAGAPPLAGLALPRLFRRPAIEADQTRLHGPGWATAILPAAAAAAYAEHLRTLAQAAPALLAAHAYVRYLGDLSGGQVLARIVGHGLQLPPDEGLAFYDFGGVEPVARLAQALRRALDELTDDEALAQRLVDEAVQAFVRHRQMFEQLAPLAPTAA